MSPKTIRVELLSVPADYGRGANDGVYYPVGLLTLGTFLRRAWPEVDVSVVDLHHDSNYQPVADVVGISASSTLNYRNVLSLASRAKNSGALVVLGGPHATTLADQILVRRREVVDYVVRGNGEVAFAALLEAFAGKGDLYSVPGLSWRAADNKLVHNPVAAKGWTYDDFVPLDTSLLSHGVEPYWHCFRKQIDAAVDCAFVVFTHFGCGYRDAMSHNSSRRPGRARWCCYCSLNGRLFSRRGEAIVREVTDLLITNRVPRGSNVLLKCYGDNVGTQQAMLHELAQAIEQSTEWGRYRIGWTFYAQSSRVSPELADALSRVGTKHLFIGFDSTDDTVQRLNGLGTSLATHRRAVRLCSERQIRIQAGFVLGCAGETTESIENTVRFAEGLARTGALERVNAGVLFIIPGSPAYSMLCDREPWIAGLDELPTEELQWHWVRHFCPGLGGDAAEGLRTLRWAANRLDELSPGPHASMGFVSDRLFASRCAVGAVHP